MMDIEKKTQKKTNDHLSLIMLFWDVYLSLKVFEIVLILWKIPFVIYI